MNITELGALADLIAAIATVVTLAFVALELRANRRQNRLTLLKTLDNGWNEINAQIAQDPVIAEIFSKGAVDPDALTDTEATQFFFLLGQYMNNHKSVWTLIQDGELDTHHEQWIKYDISAIYQLPGVWKVFLAMKDVMPEEFVEFVEEQRRDKLEFKDWREIEIR